MNKNTKKSPVKKPELPSLDDASLKNVVGGEFLKTKQDGTESVVRTIP
jgi:hypothetical protein